MFDKTKFFFFNNIIYFELYLVYFNKVKKKKTLSLTKENCLERNQDITEEQEYALHILSLQYFPFYRIYN